jgi:outer membrane receptor protein involved in Fe transport
MVYGTALGTATNAGGQGSISKVDAGPQQFVISYIGYIKQTVARTLGTGTDTLLFNVLLTADNTELDEVVINSTRTNSRIEDLPQKVEVLGEEELLEESTLKPGNISSMLGDISVIHIQQTSVTNGNVAVRMQGLDGRYTQILRDGIPAFGGFSGSFDVMSIPPLDLRQVEVIKGSASTLYGGGAIAGLINLISKTPADSNQYLFTANYSTLREANVNGFFSGHRGRTGFTMFAGTTQQAATDVNKDGFSDIPKLASYVLHPRVFVDIAGSVSMNMGYTGTFETRTGGDMTALKFKPDSLHPYLEHNAVQRHITDMQLNAAIAAGHSVSVKGAGSVFDRNINNSGTVFHGRQTNVYTELTYSWQTKTNTLLAGFNYLYDRFRLLPSDTVYNGNYNYSTYGLFVQSDWHITEKLMIQPGMRVDYHSRYKWFYLPRLALLVKPVSGVSVRVSAGAGYNTPNLFMDRSYSGKLNRISAIAGNVKPERSAGANADINYHKVFANEVGFEFNQAFYYTYLPNPLVLQPAGNNMYAWANSAYKVHSAGTDTYIRLAYRHFEFYIGYNHTTSLQTGSGPVTNVSYAPQDKLSNTLMYEIAGKWRFGLEGSLIANQYNDQNQRVRNYYLLAAMVERKIGKRWNIILNGENLLNVRQSAYQALYNGTVQNPVFNQLYAPVDGWVLNLCVQVRL